MSNSVSPSKSESSPDDPTANSTKPFPDLRSGGRALASELEFFRNRDDVVVLGIVLGGVLVAHEVANHLRAPLELVLIRRLLTPEGPGSQICAVSVAGSIVLDEKLPPRPEVPSTPLDYFIEDALAGLKQRQQLCRGDRPPLEVTGKTVVLVDCGIHTAMTMQAAIHGVRMIQPKKIIAAVPVASIDGLKQVEGIADEIVCVTATERFGHTGLWYKDFSRPGDQGISKFL
jgi:putative phosphoribosyl transferase